MKEGNVQFWTNPDIDLTEIADSMELDSEQTIATLSAFGCEASLEVRGEVRIFWNERGDPGNGEYFRYPSEFPENLKALIHKGVTKDGCHWTCDKRLYVSENNWFELFIRDENGNDVADVVDVEGNNYRQIFDLMYDSCKEFAETYAEPEKASAK